MRAVRPCRNHFGPVGSGWLKSSGVNWGQPIGYLLGLTRWVMTAVAWGGMSLSLPGFKRDYCGCSVFVLNDIAPLLQPSGPSPLNIDGVVLDGVVLVVRRILEAVVVRHLQQLLTRVADEQHPRVQQLGCEHGLPRCVGEHHALQAWDGAVPEESEFLRPQI